MSKTRKFTSTLLLSLVCATAAAQDWVDESNEHTTVVLKAQSQFQPEGASGTGLYRIRRVHYGPRAGLVRPHGCGGYGVA